MLGLEHLTGPTNQTGNQTREEYHMIMHRNYIKLKQTNFILLDQHINQRHILKVVLPCMNSIIHVYKDCDFLSSSEVINKNIRRIYTAVLIKCAN